MNEVQPSPTLYQHREREPAPRTLCPLSYHRFLPFGGRIVPLRHVAHNRGGGLARLLERECRTGAQRYSPLVAIQSVLAKISSAAAGCYTHGEPALRIVKNESILARTVDC